MRNLKISMLCSVFMLLLAFGCQKTAEQLTPVFVEKTFYPTGEEDAKARVTTFLDAVEAQKKGVASRTTFQDMEVNEGRWTLEGAANYEKNVNLASHNLGESQIYTISISNIEINGVLHMGGGSMTSEYGSLFAVVATEESNNSLLALAADVRIKNVTLTETDLEVEVFYSSEVSGLEWTVAADSITTLANDAIPSGPPCSSTFSPDIIVFESDLTTFTSDINSVQIRCSSSRCFSSLYNEPFTDYNENNLIIDRNTALQIGNEQIAAANSGPPSYPYPLYLRSVQVSSLSNILPFPATWRTLFVRRVVGAYQTYCY